MKTRRLCMNYFLKQMTLEQFLSILSAMGLCLFFSACTSVDTILLTSKAFPPKRSVNEVAVLQQMPTQPHRELAELRIGDSFFRFESLQHKILDKAAALGADAVVFAEPQTQKQHHVAYESLYAPWGVWQPILWARMGLWWGRVRRSRWTLELLGDRVFRRCRGSV